MKPFARKVQYSFFSIVCASGLTTACLREFPTVDGIGVLALFSAGDDIGSTNSTSESGLTLGGTVSGLTGTLILENNATETVSINASGSFAFARRFLSGESYNVTIQSAPATQVCSIQSGSGVFAAASVTFSVQCLSQNNIPATAPAVVSSTPAGGAVNVAPCSGTPCFARLVLRFDQTMDTGVSPAISAQVSGNTTGVSIVSSFWSSTNFVDDSVTISLSWVQLPENSSITITFPQSNYQDLEGLGLAANYVLNFSSGIGGFYQTAASGQVTCSNGTTEAACPHGVYGQDGDYAGVLSARSFSGPDNSVFSTDYTTRDAVTGLTWATCPQGMTYTAGDCTSTVTTTSWYTALNACAGLNLANAGSGYGGQTGWRLPTRREFLSLSNFGSFAPAIDVSSFDSLPNSGPFWVATTSPAAASFAPATDIANGIDFQTTKGSAAATRCVTGNGSSRSLTDNGDGTVTDGLSGLVWMKCSFGQTGSTCASGVPVTATSDAAITQCEGLTLGGRSDWRLPGIHEFRSILDFSRSAPPIDPGVFVSQAAVYATSTDGFSAPASIWALDLAGTGSMVIESRGNSLRFRCVAGP